MRDPAQAAALVGQRWAKRTAAARAGLCDAAKVLSEKAGLALPNGVPLKDEYDVVRVLTTQHAVNAVDPSGLGAAQTMKLAVDGAFPKPDATRSAQPNAVQVGGANLSDLDATALDALLAALRARAAAGRGS